MAMGYPLRTSSLWGDPLKRQLAEQCSSGQRSGSSATSLEQLKQKKSNPVSFSIHGAKERHLGDLFRTDGQKRSVPGQLQGGGEQNRNVCTVLQLGRQKRSVPSYFIGMTSRRCVQGDLLKANEKKKEHP